MAVYEFLIFNRRGDCLLHEDYTNTQPMHDKRVMKERQKLVFGLLWSLREFSKMISPGPLVTFNNYATHSYRLHVYELMTGIKFVAITSLELSEDLKNTLKQVHMLYVTYLAKNVGYELGTEIRSPIFKRLVRETFS